MSLFYPFAGHAHWAQVKVRKATGSHGQPVSCEVRQEGEGKGGAGIQRWQTLHSNFPDTNTYWQSVSPPPRPRGKTFTSLPLHSPPSLGETGPRRDLLTRRERRRNGREHSVGFSPAVKEGMLTPMAVLRSSHACTKVTGYPRAHERRGWNRCKVVVIWLKH